MSEKDKLFPGDFIANEEEFLPGKGAFSDEGDVKAANYGVLDKDTKRRVARVDASTNVPKPMKEGLVVAGVVTQVRDKVAFVELIPFTEGNVRWIAPSDSAVLRVANVKRGYVETMMDEFAIGDIVRVKITHIEDNSVVLTTDAKDLGVIKAFCRKCRGPLENVEGELKCTACNWRDTRKLADDYGEGVLIK